MVAAKPSGSGLSFELTARVRLLSVAAIARWIPQPLLQEFDAPTRIGRGLAYVVLLALAATALGPAFERLH